MGAIFSAICSFGKALSAPVDNCPQTALRGTLPTAPLDLGRAVRKGFARAESALFSAVPIFSISGVFSA
jgi:hypothetical protein